MSWSGTYSHNVLLAIDLFAAVIFWNVPDITISSMCGIAMLADAGVFPWKQRLAALNLYGWQLALLRWIGPRLNRIEPNHCRGAMLADLGRAKRIEAMLAGAPTPG